MFLFGWSLQIEIKELYDKMRDVKKDLIFCIINVDQKC